MTFKLSSRFATKLKHFYILPFNIKSNIVLLRKLIKSQFLSFNYLFNWPQNKLQFE